MDHDDHRYEQRRETPRLAKSQHEENEGRDDHHEHRGPGDGREGPRHEDHHSDPPPPTESNREIQREGCDEHEECTERNRMLGGPECAETSSRIPYERGPL